MNYYSTLIEKDTSTLGGKISALRKHKNVGQKNFALHLHVSISTISNYENNVHEPDLSTLVKIADYFNVSTDYLLNRTQYTYPLSVFDTKYIADYTASAFLNTTLQLSPRSQTDLINFLIMLNMRDKSPFPLTLDL